MYVKHLLDSGIYIKYIHKYVCQERIQGWELIKEKKKVIKHALVQEKRTCSKTKRNRPRKHALDQESVKENNQEKRKKNLFFLGRFRGRDRLFWVEIVFP